MKCDIVIPWHETEAGCWSASFACRGYRARVMQRVVNGPYYRVISVGHTQQGWRSLKTRDRDTAQKQITALLRNLARAPQKTQTPAAKPAGQRTTSKVRQLSAETLTLELLWDEYSLSATFQANTRHTRLGKEATARILLAAIGCRTRVLALDADTIKRFVNERRKGGIEYRVAIGKQHETRVTPAVGDRTIESDLQLLRAMLRWAMTVKTKNGDYLLKEFPIRGLELPHEASPHRPVITHERVEKLIAAARRLAEQATNPRDAVRYAQLELLLILMEAFGRRPANIRRLQWRDVFLAEPGTNGRSYINWRKDADKKGAQVETKIPARHVKRIRELRAILAAIGGTWIFRLQNHDRPQSTTELGRWLRQAEGEAGVEHIPGAAFYPVRRKWATERKDFPLKDVMEAGGWRDPETLLQYQAADQETIDHVVDSPIKLTVDGLREVNLGPSRPQRLSRRARA